MNHHYEDIRSRIPEAPKWWDEEAVPRYCEFAPGEVANIYADEVVLLEIECQGCGFPFRVAMSSTAYGRFEREAQPLDEKSIRALHYGDPPNVGCCAAGATMNSVPKRVVEFWRRGGQEFTAPHKDWKGIRVCLPGYFDWRRLPELEIEIDCEWAAP